jgi:hypothetical protein
MLFPFLDVIGANQEGWIAHANRGWIGTASKGWIRRGPVRMKEVGEKSHD